MAGGGLTAAQRLAIISELNARGEDTSAFSAAPPGGGGGGAPLKRAEQIAQRQDLLKQGLDQGQFDKQAALLQRLDRANRMAERPFATGLIGGFTAKHEFGGTAGNDLNKYLAPLRTNEFTSALQDMRNNSPTGGAVGQVDKGERESFESANASLNVGQGREQFQSELGALRQAKTRALKGLDPSNPLDVSEIADPSQIPQGAYFRAPNGRVYQNRKGTGAAGENPDEAALRRQAAAAQKYRGALSPPGAATNPWVPQSTEAYNRLPVGSYYLHPRDLVVYKKK